MQEKKTYIHLVIFNHGKNRLEVSGSFEMFVTLLRGLLPETNQALSQPQNQEIQKRSTTNDNNH
mgnify:CR=1 FL=1